MSRREPSNRDCARALWLLGLVPPVTGAELTAAWRSRVVRSHPDRHATSAAKVDAAEKLTRALNDARDVLAEWIASGRSWPDARGRRVVRFDDPEPWPERPPEQPVSPICRRTGLRRGDRVRVWPYDDAVRVVTGTEEEPLPGGAVWVHLDDGIAARADRVRLAAFACPVCGFCAGPRVEHPTQRPCPDCLVDLRLLERRPAEARRVRSAIEARAEAGRVTATGLGDGRLAGRAADRRRWARRLHDAGQDDLHAALLSAFSTAFERWSASAA